MLAAVKELVRQWTRRSPYLYEGLVRYRRWKFDFKHKNRSQVVQHAFGILNLELTNKCPMRCVMCARTNNMKREQGLMDFETFKAVIDEYVAANPERAAKEDTWLHHFGESLVHPDFARFVRYAVDQGVRACMSINPIMLAPKTADDLLDSGIHKLYVSLDGHDDESFYKIRGVENAYEKSKSNLLEFLKKKVARGGKPTIVLSMINFSLNEESIARMKDYWGGVAGIDEYLCKDFVTWNGDAVDVNGLAKRRVDNAELRKTNRTPACNLPWESVSVTWDGDAVPCCFDYDKKYPLGNVKKQSLSEIWNGEPMRKLREEFISNNVTNPLCRDCQYLYPFQ